MRAETWLQQGRDASHCCSPTKGVRRSAACIREMGGVLHKCVACEGHSEKRTLLYLPNYKASVFFSCQLKNEGLPYSCAQSENSFCIGLFLEI